ncbi:hypothetical protein HK405_004929 [Cladochytrium tenue]|nr:hypothetical protein HK405_004929 [Cladochytrium tenue]
MHPAAVLAAAAILVAASATSAAAAPASVPASRNHLSRRYYSWELGNSGKVTWAYNCDWTGGDLTSVSGKAGADCGGLCLSTSGCVYFTWSSYNSGTCWLKSSSASALVSGSGTVCGRVIQDANGRLDWAAGNAGQVSWASGCDWSGGDLTSVSGKAGEDCGALCLATSGCTKFSWTSYNSGTCWLKGSSASASVVSNSGGICGIIAHSSSLSWADATTQAAALVSTLSLDEKISLVSGLGWGGGACVGNTASLVSIGFQGLCLQDSPTGVRFASNVSAFPAAINVAATFDKTLMYNNGLYMGREARGKGVNVLLAPAMNIMRAPEGGRSWESGGGDAVLTSFSASQQVQGIQASGVIATAKHYILNDQEYDREGSNSEAGARALHEVYLRPFKACVDAGVGAVMCSYNSINGTLACENSAALSILKSDLGYSGFVMTDWWATTAVSGSANAGSDLMMPGDTSSSNSALVWGANLESAVNSGAVASSRVDNMATRILASWIKAGQNDNTFPAIAVSGSLNVQADHNTHIREVGAASAVLLKNAGNHLPITASAVKNLAVIGEDSLAPKTLNGCSDHGCIDGTVAQGWGSGTTNFPYIVAPVDGITTKASALGITVTSNGTNQNTAATVAAAADLAVVFVFADSGEEYITVEGNKGDRNDLNLWHNGNTLVQQVAAVQKTVVVVHAPGPVVMPWINNTNVVAVIMALMPGQETGNAIADVLFGDVNPSGRLPFTIGASRTDYAADVTYSNAAVSYGEGILIDYKWFEATGRTPVFPFGHGLSYTTFTYSGLTVTGNGDGSYAVAVTVANTGAVAGHEVVQLYVKLPASTCQSQGCSKELRNFERVSVAAGASTSVSFTLSKADLEYYSVASGAWVLPSGTVQVMVGASSQDIRLSTTISL